jgi:hypothetical protein
MRKMSSLALVALAVSSAALASTGARPTLRLTDTLPLTVTGVGFHGREHVTVVYATTTRRWTHAAVATAAGSFTARFAGVGLNVCAAKSITAAGSMGSHAALVLPKPLCPPPAAEP